MTRFAINAVVLPCFFFFFLPFRPVYPSPHTPMARCIDLASLKDEWQTRLGYRPHSSMGNGWKTVSMINAILRHIKRVTSVLAVALPEDLRDGTTIEYEAVMVLSRLRPSTDSSKNTKLHAASVCAFVLRNLTDSDDYTDAVTLTVFSCKEDDLPHWANLILHRIQQIQTLFGSSNQISSTRQLPESPQSDSPPPVPQTPTHTDLVWWT
jgi:hypothetical protein